MTAPVLDETEKAEAAETDDAPRRRISRRRLRVILLLAGVIPALLAFGLVMKVSVMMGHDSNGRQAFDDKDYEEAATEFGANGTWNWFESWVSPFDKAVALHAQGLDLVDDEDPQGARKKLDAAIAAYETALKSVPEAEECRVRTNLSLAHEANGDAAKVGPPPDVEQAIEDWRAGIKAVTDGGCTPPKKGDEAPDEDGGGAEPAAYLTTARTTVTQDDSDDSDNDSDAGSVADRLRKKIEEEQQKQEQQQKQQQQGQGGGKSKKEKDLDKRNQQGQEKRKDQQEGPGEGKTETKPGQGKPGGKRSGGPNDPDPKW